MNWKPHERVIRAATAALLNGEWTEDDMVRKVGAALGRQYRFLRPFVRRVLAAFPTRPKFMPLAAVVEADEKFARGCRKYHVQAVRILTPKSVMDPVPAAAGWSLPPLTTLDAVADWLRIDPHRLSWFADVAGRNCREPAGPLRHYQYAWIPKRGGRPRLLEIPKPELKRIQRRILDTILNPIPPHPAAHGFRPGHSIRTNAVAHCGKTVVLRFDLADFFGSVAGVRVFALFRTVGYPPEVANVLTGLCTARLPRDVWEARPNPARDGSDHPTWQRLGDRHLPQGAPTSPALANLIAYRLDVRLSALATMLGATYTRYADDLTFSGGDVLRDAAGRMRRAVAEIAGGEGFLMNVRKSRVLPHGGRQVVAGVVVNAVPNIRRDDFDLLKAILTNCVRHGPSTQNRENHPDFRGHLAGKVGHVRMLNPIRGAKLRAVFDRIDWSK